MNLSELSVKRPVMTIMFFAGVLVLGIISLIKLPLDVMPEMEPPAISVVTVYPGANAEDVENNVTKYIEERLSIINNLKHIYSRSKENLSIVTCEFEWGTNLDEAANDIRDGLEFAKRYLPDDVEKSIVFKFNSSHMPIFLMTISTDNHPEDLYFFVDKKIKRELQKIPGVGAVNLNGGLRRQITVYLKPFKMKNYGISVEDVANAIKANNINIPAGSLELGDKKLGIRVRGRVKNVDVIKNIVVGYSKNGGFVYLKDIADVKDDFKEQTLVNYDINKNEALIVEIQKRSGANTVEVAKRVKKRLKELRKILPKGTKIDIIVDNSKFIVNSVKNLSSSIIYGGIFVILITFLFLRNLRASFIISMSIPLSLIWAFIIMYVFDFSINLMSLMGLSIVVGMVVDNSVVVIENIFKHFEYGDDRKFASIYGAWEMGSAILASSLTTVVIFVPMIFVSGIVGIFFKQLAVLVVFTILASWFTSITITPSLSSLMLMKPSGNFYKKTEKYFVNLEKFYAKIVEKVLKMPYKFLFLMLVIFVISLFLAGKIQSEFMPDEDTGDFQIQAQLDVGTKLDKTKKVAMELIRLLRQEKAVKTAAIRYGQSKQGFAELFGIKEGSNVIMCWGKLVDKSERNRSVQEIASEIANKLQKKYQEIDKIDVKAGNMIKMLMFAGQKPITIEIAGEDLKQGMKLAHKIEDVVKSVKGTRDVTVSMDNPKIELTVRLKRRLAQEKGLNPAIVGKILRTYFYGMKVSKFHEQGEEFDIFLRLGKNLKNDINTLKSISVENLKGEKIRLDEIADINFEAVPEQIERKDRERIIKVEANLNNRALSAIISDIKEKMKKIGIPEGFSVKFAGDVENQKESFRNLIMLLIVGILLVYMVMAGQFESLKMPFIIMFSIPFTFTGVIISFLITGTTLSVNSFLGIIILMGIVVNNAIVLIDYINLMRKRGMNLKEAVILTGQRRLRPILITTFTTILGMLPMALTNGPSSEVYNPLGITVIGGLSVSTLVTLLIIPCIYYVIERKKAEV